MIKKDWTIEFKKLTRAKGVDALRVEITPFRDWRVVIIVFFIILTVSVGFNIFVASEANRDTLFSAVPKSVGVVKFNQEGLTKVIKEIDEKAARFEKAKTEKIPVVDPSL